MTDNHTHRRWPYRLLWVIALLSLGLNIALFIGLLSFRFRAEKRAQEAAAVLDMIELNNLDIPIHVDETLALSLTVPFKDTFVVPISNTVPVSTQVLFEDTLVVPINTIIPLNNTVEVAVDIPLAGRVILPIPIVANIPVNLDVDVTISKTIPIQTDIPVNFLVEVPIESDVPIQTDIPVQLDFPVTITLEELGLEDLFAKVQEAMDLLTGILGAP
jgi:hypothetical protein